MEKQYICHGKTPSHFEKVDKLGIERGDPPRKICALQKEPKHSRHWETKIPLHNESDSVQSKNSTASAQSF